MIPRCNQKAVGEYCTSVWIARSILSIRQYVIACVLVHNFCIRAGDSWDEPPDDYDDDGSDDDNDDVVGDGEHVRQNLINYVNCL